MSHSPEFIQYEVGYHAFRTGIFDCQSGIVIDIEYPLDDFMYNIDSKYPTYTGAEFGDLAKHQTKYDNERELYSMWQMEAFNMNGMPATWHIITFDTSYDPLFGEDNDKRVERSFPVQMYIPETPDNNRIWTIFGAEGVNDLIFYINKEHFKFASQCGMPSDYPNGSSDNAMYPTDWTRNHIPAMEQSGTGVRTGGVANTEFSDAFELGTPLKSHIPKVGDIFVLEYDQKSVYEVKRVREEEEMFLQKKHCWIIESTKLYVNEHINKNTTGTQPTNYIDPELERVIDEPELYDDRSLPDIAKASTEVVPDTFPATTGKGKPNPFYTPRTSEKAPNDPFGGF
jgi:hypothetical protein